jgi:HTH-type transcriptional regulator/antitoxin HipB
MNAPITTPLLLGHTLVGLRKQKGITQLQLARFLGISQNRLSVLEHNPGTLTVERLLWILNVLQLDLHLIDRNTNEPPATEW